MTWPRALPLILLLLLAGVIGRGVHLGRGGRIDQLVEPGGSATAQVVRVIDGDTIVAELGGERVHVRYIGMDTPETVKPNTPVQCYGPTAHSENARLVGGRQVILRFDRELRDRYGRLLAYVYRRSDGLFVNARLVADGAARTLAIAPNTAHELTLSRLEATAQRADRGQWRACRGAP
jgi:micrococcal nuclease